MVAAKINVLCLHGCCQTSEAFSSYLNSLIKMSKKSQYGNIEFHFLTGPFPHPDGGLSWTDPPLQVDQIWRDCTSETSSFTAITRDSPLTAVPSLLPVYCILETTFALIDAAIVEKEITVLLGFSQGSFAIYEYMKVKKNPMITRIVTMSGYTFAHSVDELDIPLLSGSEELPILNVVNPMDNVVPASLAKKGGNVVYTLTHNNKGFTEPVKEAHVVPTRAADMRAILDFIKTGTLTQEE